MLFISSIRDIISFVGVPNGKQTATEIIRKKLKRITGKRSIPFSFTYSNLSWFFRFVRRGVVVCFISLVGWLVISHSTVIMIPFFHVGARDFLKKNDFFCSIFSLTRFLQNHKQLILKKLRKPGCREVVSR